MPLSPFKSGECIRLAEDPRANRIETALEHFQESRFGAAQILDLTGLQAENTQMIILICGNGQVTGMIEFIGFQQGIQKMN